MKNEAPMKEDQIIQLLNLDSGSERPTNRIRTVIDTDNRERVSVNVQSTDIGSVGRGGRVF